VYLNQITVHKNTPIKRLKDSSVMPERHVYTQRGTSNYFLCNIELTSIMVHQLGQNGTSSNKDLSCWDSTVLSCFSITLYVFIIL